jgi:dTDP-4-amino-4,6-dideoxygalactose transaminase
MARSLCLGGFNSPRSLTRHIDRGRKILRLDRSVATFCCALTALAVSATTTATAITLTAFGGGRSLIGR